MFLGPQGRSLGGTRRTRSPAKAKTDLFPSFHMDHIYIDHIDLFRNFLTPLQPLQQGLTKPEVIRGHIGADGGDICTAWG